MVLARSVDLRLAGQYHELTIPFDLQAAPAAQRADALAAAFAGAYAERYGRMLTGLPIEATTWRLHARGPEGRVRLLPRPAGDADPQAALRGQRPVYAGEALGFVDTPVYDRLDLLPGARPTGPAIVEEPAATVVLLPGDAGEINPYGALVVRRGGAA
jgi:N-methylhydantoinase A